MNYLRQKNNKRSGQVMLLTILILSAVFLSVTVIAGFIMVEQLNEVTRIIDSQEAIFAAEAGIDRGLFRVFRCNPSPVVPSSWQDSDIAILCSLSGNPDSNQGLPLFLNNASYRMSISGTAFGSHNPNLDPSQVVSIKATGRSGRTARAFEVQF